MTSSLPRRPLALATALVALVALAGCRNQPTDSTGGSPSTAPSALPAGSSSHTVDVDGASRTYRTYVPDGLDRSNPVPLVVMLHGGMGSAEQAEEAYGWDAKADAEGFVVAYPDGERRTWNAGSCCGPAAKNGIDDVGFIIKVVETLRTQADIDPRRTYVTGMSNGAMMSLRLACETDLFAAAAPVAGAQMVSCDSPRPISVIHIHGTEDHSVPIDGSPGDGIGNVPVHPAIADSVAHWRSVDACGEPVVTSAPPVTTTSAECESGRAVTLITVDGAGHQWPGASERNARLHKLLGADPPSTAINATDVIWSFFADHPAPE